MTDLDATIARVRELDVEATAAPWRPEREPQPVRCDWLDRHCGDGSAPIESTGTAFAFGVAVAVTAEKHDAALIAYYRTACPQLAAECARLQARVRELEEERDAERLRYGQQRAANAVWMQHAAWLARHGQQEVALRVRAQADAAASSVRAEDFVVARAALKGGG